MRDSETFLPPISRSPQRGVTLVELMVSLAIGLLLVVAMSAIFVGSSRSRLELESSADAIESGRYAVDALNRELSTTGFYGTLTAPTGATSNAGAAMCTTGAANIAQWQDSLPYYVAGLASAGGVNVDADPSCPSGVVGRKAGTDAVFVQRASTCAVGDTGCEAETTNNAYLQVSECGTQYSLTPIVLAQGLSGSTVFTMQTKTCVSTATTVKRKLIRRIFYIASNDTLNYQDIPLSGALQPPVLLAENIEQMQIEYAVDANGDGTPETFVATPTDWSQVIGMRLWLLARSTDKSLNTNKAMTFVMSGDTTVSIPAAATNYKRRVYSTYITFVTPKMRRES